MGVQSGWEDQPRKGAKNHKKDHPREGLRDQLPLQYGKEPVRGGVWPAEKNTTPHPIERNKLAELVTPVMGYHPGGGEVVTAALGSGHRILSGER